MTWDKGLPSKTQIEGNKIVRRANKMPRNVIDKPLILKGSSSLSNSLETAIREEVSLTLLLTNCFEFVYFKSFDFLNLAIYLT